MLNFAIFSRTGQEPETRFEPATEIHSATFPADCEQTERTYVPLGGKLTKSQHYSLRLEFEKEFKHWLDSVVKFKVGDIKHLDPLLYNIYCKVKQLFDERFKTIINDSDYSNLLLVYNDRINYFEQYLQNLMQTTIESEGEIVDISKVITIERFETLKEIFDYRSALEQESFAA